MEAAAAGTRRIRPKMAEAVSLAKLHPAGDVDQALGTAAIAGRFAENDLLRILAHQAGRSVDKPTAASESHSLQRGTGAWSRFGRSATDLDDELPACAADPAEDHPADLAEEDR